MRHWWGVLLALSLKFKTWSCLVVLGRTLCWGNPRKSAGDGGVPMARGGGTILLNVAFIMLRTILSEALACKNKCLSERLQ